MFIRKRYKKLSLISEFIIVTMVLGAFLVLIQDDGNSAKKIDFSDSDTVQSDELRSPQNLFAGEISDKTNEIESIQAALLKSHGINLCYGDSTRGVGKIINGEELYDLSTIYTNVNMVKKALDKYPNGFFNEFKTGKNNYSISIYLIDKFNNDNIALATRNTKNDFKIYLSSKNELENVLHHELFHIIEYYLQLEFDTSVLFGKWKNNNPSGYVYPNSTKNITIEYVTEEKKVKNNIYFVTRYAKTSEKEDRAETFADLMKEQSKPYYYKKNFAIYNKALIIKNVLESKFRCVTADNKENWEQYLD